MNNSNYRVISTLSNLPSSAQLDMQDEREQVEASLVALVQRFLDTSAFAETAATLRRELETLASRAGANPQTQRSLRLAIANSTQDSHLSGDQLFRICQRLVSIVDVEVPLRSTFAPSVPSLLRRGRHSVFRTKESNSLKLWGQEELSNCPFGAPKVASICLQHRFNLWNLNAARPRIGRPFPPSHYSKSFITRFHLQAKILGHLAPITCVTFDQTGRYLLTGSEDGLVKLWNVELCRLVYTFRFLLAGVTDLEVDEENKILAAGCRRGMLTTWQLQEGKLTSYSTQHQGGVCGISFIPYYDVNKRYMISVGEDGCACFYKYKPEDCCFSTSPERFTLQIKQTGRLTSITSTDGGQFVVVCGNGSATAIFTLMGDHPSPVEFIKSETDPVNFVSWASRNLRFLTWTIRNGLVKIWQYQRQEWKPLMLDLRQTPVDQSEGFRRQQGRVRAKLVTWNCNDTRVVVVGSDEVVRVFEPVKGRLLRIIDGFSINVAGVEPHPIDPDMFALWSRTGTFVICNMADGVVLCDNGNRSYETDEETAIGFLFSPDGNRMCIVDCLGRLVLYGVGVDRPNVPYEQFFHTDYSHLTSERGQAPEFFDTPFHRFPPPYLVNSEGTAYSGDLQALVPGRERLTADLLNPNITIRRVPVRYTNQLLHVFIPLSGWRGSGNDIESCWLTRPVVPPLSEGRLEMLFAKVKCLANDERFLYELESAKERVTEPAVETTRRRQSRQEVPEVGDTLLPDYSDTEWDPDYTEASPMHVRPRAGVRTRQAPADSESEEDEASVSAPSTNQYTSPDDESVTSNSDESDEVILVRGRRRVELTRTASGRLPRPAATPNAQAVVRPAVRTFSEWITCTSNRAFPYFPQKGDDVVYFVQGHKLYVDAVTRNNMYRVETHDLPWMSNPQLLMEEPAVVEEVSFSVAEVRLCRLVLRLMGSHVSADHAKVIVQFHDVANVADFLVLRQFYNCSLDYDWQPGERFQTLIEDTWWTGRIVQRQAYDIVWPTSNFQCLLIAWEDGTEERLSPWDIQPYSEEARQSTERPVLWKYDAEPDEWPACGMEAECNRLVAGITELIANYSFTDAFVNPVDLETYPTYASMIQYPSDLGTIKQRLENRYYRRLESVKNDVMYISKNARIFNIPNSSIIERADLLTRILLAFIRNSNSNNLAQTVRRCRPVSRDGESTLAWFGQMSADDWRLRCHKALEALRRIDTALFENFEPVEQRLCVDDYESAAQATQDILERLESLSWRRNARVREKVTQMREQIDLHLHDLINGPTTTSGEDEIARRDQNTRNSGRRSRRYSVSNTSEVDHTSEASFSYVTTSQPVDSENEDNYSSEAAAEETSSDEEYVEASSSNRSSRTTRRNSRSAAYERDNDGRADDLTLVHYELRRKRRRVHVADTSNEDEENVPNSVDGGIANDGVIVSRSSRGRLIRRRQFD